MTEISEKKSIGYQRFFYELDIEKWRFLPSLTGLYVHQDDYSLYCGSCKSLRERVPNSARECGLRKKVLIYDESHLFPSDEISMLKFFRAMEEYCIQALFTIIWAHKLPVNLLNIQHKKFLPISAWLDDAPPPMVIAIEVAQAVLYKMGFPLHLISISDYRWLPASQQRRLTDQDVEAWIRLFKIERRNRTGRDYPESVMRIIPVK
jgi:hypothetical protein